MPQYKFSVDMQRAFDAGDGQIQNMIEGKPFTLKGENPILSVVDVTNNCSTLFQAQDLFAIIGTSTNHQVFFATNSQVAMTLDTGQRVGFGTTDPDDNSQVDISSTTRALTIPRMTETQRDAISSPIAGMIIYNTTTNLVNFYNGSAWGAI